MITIAAIRAVADLGGDPVVPEHCREAAVAMILLQGESSFEMMFILRARKEGDPWSGQMALPGGHREPQDLTLAETAARETWEETGLDLAQHGEFLGGLSGVRANPRSGIDLMVVPQVFELQARPSQLAPNHEVQKVLWGDVADMYSGTSRTDASFPEFNRHGTFPGFKVDDQVVWGLTFRMLNDLFDAVGR